MSDNWRELLKAGDPVIVMVGHYGTGDILNVRKVDRLTDTQIIIGRSRFKKTTGKQICSDKWNFDLLLEATPERLVVATEAEKRRRLINRIESVKPSTLPTEVLERIVAAMGESSERMKQEGLIEKGTP